MEITQKLSWGEKEETTHTLFTFDSVFERLITRLCGAY